MIAGTFKEEPKCETQELTCLVGEMFHSSAGKLDVISPRGLIWQPASLSLTSLMPSHDWKTVEINKPSTLITITILSHKMIGITHMWKQCNHSHSKTYKTGFIWQKPLRYISILIHITSLFKDMTVVCTQLSVLQVKL